MAEGRHRNALRWPRDSSTKTKATSLPLQSQCHNSIIQTDGQIYTSHTSLLFRIQHTPVESMFIVIFWGIQICIHSKPLHSTSSTNSSSHLPIINIKDWVSAVLNLKFKTAKLAIQKKNNENRKMIGVH